MPGKNYHPESLRRVDSKMVGELVETEFAHIYLINKDGSLTLLTPEEDVTDSVLVGRGNQGSVYAVVVEFETSDGSERRLCALKQLPKQKKFGQKTNTEMESIHINVTAEQKSSIQHNVIQGMATIVNQGSRFLMLPFSGLFLEKIMRDLPSLKEDKERSHLHDSVVLHVITDLFAAIKFLHDKDIVHRDIKEDNIAIHLGHIVLMDFETACPINATKDKVAGSPFYMHPLTLLGEKFLGEKFQCAKQNDIYALGVVLKLILGDKKTWEKRKEWDACKDKSDVSKKIAAESDAALTLFQERRDTSPVSHDLDKELGRYTSVRRKLEELANLMTSPWPFDQPNINQLITYCDTLKNQFLESHSEFGTAVEQEKELKDYYDSLIQKDFLLLLSENITSPLRNTVSQISLYNERVATESQGMTSTSSRSGLFSTGSQSVRSVKSVLEARQHLDEFGKNEVSVNGRPPELDGKTNAVPELKRSKAARSVTAALESRAVSPSSFYRSTNQELSTEEDGNKTNEPKNS